MGNEWERELDISDAWERGDEETALIIENEREEPIMPSLDDTDFDEDDEDAE